MAMINDVRNTVLAIINKNNYGYLSPQDFNLYAQQAQMDLFEDYFYQYNQWINRENVRQSGTGYADIVKSLEEVIDFFSVEVFLTGGTANTWTLPADYYLVNKLFYYPKILTLGTTTAAGVNQLIDLNASPIFSNGSVTPTYPVAGSIVVNTSTLSQSFVTTVANATTLNLTSDIFTTLGDTYSIYSANNITEVERVSQKKIFYLTSSTLTSPTKQFPAYVLGGNTVSVYPTSIQASGDIKAQYIRYPKPPSWTYVSLSLGEPTFYQSSSTFQDFELPLSDEPGLIAKICQYVGIEIREKDVYNFGQTEEVSNNQIQT
tara:strand:- start:4306 stop:5259 length:954 start_codon:yes stop_codon:yes gene_type:complete